MRKLGDVQIRVLKAMRDHGMWSVSGCGWHWNGRMSTERIIKTLVRRGLVKVETMNNGRVVYTPVFNNEST